MNKEALGAVVALALAGAVMINGAIDGTEKTYDSKEAVTLLERSKVDQLPDGGLVWYMVVLVPDGGVQIRTISQGDYVRRKPDGGVCMQRLSDGGLRDPGPWTRFPADAGVGPGCQFVASTVLGLPGAPDLEDEVNLVKQIVKSVPSTKGAGDGGQVVGAK